MIAAIWQTVSSLLAGSGGLGLPEQSDTCHLYFLAAESAAPPQWNSLLGKQTEWIICVEAKNTVKTKTVHYHYRN